MKNILVAILKIARTKTIVDLIMSVLLSLSRRTANEIDDKVVAVVGEILYSRVGCNCGAELEKMENGEWIMENEPKKVIISQPMRGKTEIEVRAERAELVKQLEADGFEVVDTVFPDFSNQGNIPLKYLAKSLEFIADVDYVYFMNGWEEARGCKIEHQVCVDYGVEILRD